MSERYDNKKTRTPGLWKGWLAEHLILEDLATDPFLSWPTEETKISQVDGLHCIIVLLYFSRQVSQSAFPYL